LHSALVEAIESIEHVVEKAIFWDKHRESGLNERQTKLLNTILDIGVNHPQSGLTSKKYMKIAQTTSTTASRDIKGLLSLGRIEQVEGTGGRSVRYLVLG